MTTAACVCWPTRASVTCGPAGEPAQRQALTAIMRLNAAGRFDDVVRRAAGSSSRPKALPRPGTSGRSPSSASANLPIRSAIATRRWKSTPTISVPPRVWGRRISAWATTPRLSSLPPGPATQPRPGGGPRAGRPPGPAGGRQAQAGRAVAERGWTVRKPPGGPWEKERMQEVNCEMVSAICIFHFTFCPLHSALFFSPSVGCDPLASGYSP